MATRERVRVILPKWHKPFVFTILGDKAIPDGYPDFPYDTDTLRQGALLWEDVKPHEEADNGWYWYDVEYPDEGLCGPFQTRADAKANAMQAYEDENQVGFRHLPSLPDVTDRAYCAWCDNRSLKQPVPSLDERTGREGSTVWLCNLHAAEAVDLIEDLVRQHCHESWDDNEESPVFESAALRVNCQAMRLLIREKRMREVGSTVGRMMIARFLNDESSQT